MVSVLDFGSKGSMLTRVCDREISCPSCVLVIYRGKAERESCHPPCACPIHGEPLIVHWHPGS